MSTTYLNCKLKGREIDCFNMQGPPGSFKATHRFEDLSFWGPCDWLFQWEAEGQSLCRLFKQNPKHHFQKSQARKVEECDWTGRRKEIFHSQFSFHTIPTHNHLIYHFAKSLTTQFYSLMIWIVHNHYPCEFVDGISPLMLLLTFELLLSTQILIWS